MATQRDLRVLELIDQALEQPTQIRAAFVRSICGDDEDLYHEVMATLAAEPEDLMASPLMDHDRFQAPEQVGVYRILGELGRGGMGVVYQAEDRRLERTVAIKFLKRGMDSERILHRFWEERRMLAGFDHPHIARLYDGGTDHEDRPYLVMEYVDGLPIHVFCNERRLTIRERLELMLKVCDAVAAAHRRLIIHRDLKPGNILVTAEGEPKLLDFGIAKTLQADLDLPITETVHRIMTPAYASPEQHQGGPITTACDIYSLGVLLFELLTDQLPERERSLQEAIRQADDGVGLKRQTTLKRLKKDVRGDLDAVVRKALRTEPSQRYSSAEHFADDLRAHLYGKPVSVRGDDMGYRFGKFVCRHQFKVMAIAALFFAVTLFPIGYGMAEQRERLRTQQALQRAEIVSEFLVDLFEQSDPRSLEEVYTVRELLDQGARDIRVALRDQWEDRAALLDTMGRVFMNLGEFHQAKDFLEEAKALRNGFPGYGQTIANLGMLHHHMGDDQQAETLLRESLMVQTCQKEPADLYVETLGDLARVVCHRGDYEGAMRYYHLAIERSEGLGKTLSMKIHANMAQALFEQKRYAAAILAARQALADQDDQTAAAFNLWWLLARAYYDTNQFEQARKAYDAANQRRRHAQILPSDETWRSFFQHPLRKARHDQI